MVFKFTTFALTNNQFKYIIYNNPRQKTILRKPLCDTPGQGIAIVTIWQDKKKHKLGLRNDTELIQQW